MALSHSGRDGSRAHSGTTIALPRSLRAARFGRELDEVARLDDVPERARHCRTDQSCRAPSGPSDTLREQCERPWADESA